MTEKDVEKIKQALEQTVAKIYEAGKHSGKEPYRATERRLRAYPVLKANIDRYKADIEDIKHEDFGKSKSIVLFQTHSGKTPQRDIEELREAKIFDVTLKLVRDEKEVEEVETALAYIKDYAYHDLIEMIYFKNMDHQAIEERLHCDRSTIYRNRKILVSRISEVLYGADAL